MPCSPPDWSTADGRAKWPSARIGAAWQAPADIQIFETGYRTPAHDIIQWNENDLAGKGTVMGKATVTALLFRELYEGSVGTAQSRIKAEVKNNGGNLPYLAPGIRELVGIDKFRDGEFEEGSRSRQRRTRMGGEASQIPHPEPREREDQRGRCEKGVARQACAGRPHTTEAIGPRGGPCPMPGCPRCPCSLSWKLG